MQSARGFEYGVRHIISPLSGLLSDVLVSILEISLDEVIFLLNLGSVYHNSKRILDNIPVQTGDYLRVHTKPRRFLKDPQDWNSRLIYQDSEFIVVNKVSGLPVHSSVDNIQENLQTYLEKHLQHELFITHRLDVPTCGLILFAKNKDFQSIFNKMLIQHAVQKIYLAKVSLEKSKLQVGLLKHYMEPSPRAPKRVHASPTPGWQECLLEIFRIQNFIESNEQHLHIQLHTGRTHQIRAQLSHEGSPILNDELYGAKKTTKSDQIELQAYELKFTHPISGAQHHFKLALESKN